MISTKAASNNEMLSKIATRIIVDGMKHAQMDHETAHTFVFGKPSMDMTFNDFMIEKLSIYLCGYRKGMSPQHCLLFLVEKWRKALDKGNTCGVLLTDLSKAFDCLMHRR